MLLLWLCSASYVLALPQAMPTASNAAATGSSAVSVSVSASSGSAVSSVSASAGSGSASASGYIASSTSVSTVVASATVSPNAPLPAFSSIVKQPTCTLPLYCPGYGVLENVQLSGIYSDSKTFVDKPALYNDTVVLAAFANITKGGNVTADDLVGFVDANFAGEGTNVLPADLPDYTDNPPFLANVSGSPYVNGWLKIVHSYWPSLTRRANNTALCADCSSTLIPLNNSFIVPGSRFREIYYWDTYFGMEGLLRGGLYNISSSMLLNFFDLIDYTEQMLGYGFVPNGGRIYYLNRSQPPLLTQMLALYTNYRNDTSLLARGLPALELEMAFWDSQRSMNVTSPSGRTWFVSLYAPNNTAPRPEGFVTDYQTAFSNLTGVPSLNASQIPQLFKNLAAGAESGQDYSGARWTEDPLANVTDNAPALRTLDNENIIPVDLNSILYRDYVLLSELYNMTGNTSRSSYWASRAAQRKAAIADLFLNSSLNVFNDFNITSNTTSPYWTPASLTPFWSGAIPSALLANESLVQQHFAPVAYLLAFYNGSLPASLLDTGLQWDFPSAWPPENFIAIAALQNLPISLTSTAFGTYINTSIASFPSQLGINASSIPGQPLSSNSLGDNRTNPIGFEDWPNAGNLTSGMSWRDGLVVALANRYTSSLFCSWYSTGGSIPNLLPQLGSNVLNQTMSVGLTGNMFEKTDCRNVDAAGFGGEYTVQTGFEWSNGVAIWIGAEFGANLTTPQCPPINVPSMRL